MPTIVDGVVFDENWVANIENNLRYGFVLSKPKLKKAVIKLLLHKGLNFKMISLGVGVVKFCLAEKVCPTCKGKGILD